MVSPDQARGMALALPDACEQDHDGFPSYRVRGKMFATLRAEMPRLMVKIDPEDQHNLCTANDGAVAPVPGYWGRKGSTYVDLNRIDEEMVATLLSLAHAGVWRRKRVKSPPRSDSSS